MGQGLGLALHRSGWRVLLLARTPHTVVAPLTLHAGAHAQAPRAASIVLLAVPDDAISGLSSDLASAGAIGADQTVLHLSGLLDRRALAPLAATGAGLGSFHPLQTVADPLAAPERLLG